MKKNKLILKLINSKERFSPLFVLALCLLSFQIGAAQKTPEPPKKADGTPYPKVDAPTPTPTPKPRSKPNIILVPPNTTPLPRPNPLPPKPTEAKKVIVNESFAPAEKSIAVESKVKITLCVNEGNVKINGWDRNEIRAFVQNGSQVGFKISQKNLKTNKPEWVYVQGYDAQKTKELKPEECLSGSEIELDVPRNATIELKSVESEIKIESVGKVSVKTLSGDINLNDIASGIEAATYRGDIMVERSSGQMVLTNTDGNIIALEVSPSEIGDIFKASTNSGRITLQGVAHRQVGTGSISGSISFEGELLGGGQYSFSATSGSIVLAVLPDSLCKINAWFGYGAFVSEIPLVNAMKKDQSLSAQLGETDATCSLNLKTGSGVIRIRSRKSATKDAEKSKKEADKTIKPVSQKKSLNTKKTVSSNRTQRRALQVQTRSRSVVNEIKKRQ